MADNMLPVFSPDELKEQSEKAGRHLRRMRERENFSRESVTSSSDNYREGLPSLTTLKNMESGHGETKFDTFLQMFHMFNGTDRDAAILFGNRESEIFVNDSHDSSPAHIARLKKFEYQKYSIYFLDEMDQVKELNLNFVHIVNHSYVQGNAKVGKYTYDCKLVSPCNSRFVYLYFTSTTSFIDRAFMVLPEVEKVVGRFKRGIGIMMSLSADDHCCPTLQMFILWSKKYEKLDEETIKEHLVLKRAQISKYMLRVTDLMDRNNNFMRSVKPVKKSDSSTLNVHYKCNG